MRNPEACELMERILTASPKLASKKEASVLASPTTSQGFSYGDQFEHFSHTPFAISGSADNNSEFQRLAGKMKFKLSRHANEELTLRHIPRHLLDSLMEGPQQIVSVRGNRKAYQSQLDFGGGRIFLLRAIVDDTVDPAVIVTV